MQTVVILPGAPASGKSTICELLQKQYPHIAWIHVDSFKKFINTGMMIQTDLIGMEQLPQHLRIF